MPAALPGSDSGGKGKKRGKRVTVKLGKYDREGKKKEQVVVLSRIFKDTQEKLKLQVATEAESVAKGKNGRETFLRGSVGAGSMRVILNDGGKGEEFAIPVPSWFKIKQMASFCSNIPNCTGFVSPHGRSYSVGKKGSGN